MNNIRICNEYKNANTNIIDKCMKYLFILSIILIPFDNLPYFKSLLGELSFRGSVYAFIPIIVLTFINLLLNKEIFIPKGRTKTNILLFFAWIIISTVMNLSNIFNNFFKGRTGNEKLILQLFVFAFMILMAYCTIYIIERNNMTLKDIRKYILFSFIPVGIVGAFELLTMFSIIDCSKIIENISYLVHFYNRGIVYPKGVRSVTGEASYFAMYSAFAFPFIISYVFTEHKLKNKILWSFLAAFFFILILFTKSRTAYAIIFVEIFMLFAFIISAKIDTSKKKILILIAIELAAIIFLFNQDFSTKYGGDTNSAQELSVTGLQNSLSDSGNMSNVARLGMMRAALNVGKDNPIFGVGIGQFGFYASQYVDEKALTSNEVQNWVNPKLETNFWPPCFSLYNRIIAEQGVIGILLWLNIGIYCLYRLIRRVYSKRNDFLGIALLMSFIGIAICSLNADTFAYISLWILMPLIDKYTSEKNQYEY